MLFPIVEKLRVLLLCFKQLDIHNKYLGRANKVMFSVIPASNYF